MRTLFDVGDRARVLERIAALHANRCPLWGRFTAPEMVCHVSCGLRQGLGKGREKIADEEPAEQGNDETCLPGQLQRPGKTELFHTPCVLTATFA